ncbi:MAG: BREX system ATP-binding domain-containing protein [Planctomycetota bacterium]
MKDAGLLDRGMAMRILASLGSSGKPPDRGLDSINAGNDSYLRILRREYLEGLLPAGGATFRIVQGGFGAGKTHFLYCVRELAWSLGYAVADVVLSARECPFDKSLLVYRAVAAKIAAPPADGELPREGLPFLIEDLLDRRVKELGEEAVRVWIREELRRLPSDNAAFREALSEYLMAIVDGNEERRRVLGAWLLGQELPPSLHRECGVYESISESNAFPLLRSMTQVMSRLGLRGTVILFDEGDRVMSLTASRSQRLMDNLRQLIDLCGQARFPSVMVLYAVPPEFLRNVVPDYPALHQRLSTVSPLSERSPQSPIIDLEHLDLPPAELLVAIGMKILRVFNAARGVQLDRTIQARNARVLAEVITRHHYEVSHRRVFVKTWVDLLYGQQSEGEAPIAAGQLEGIAGSTASALSAPEPLDFEDLGDDGGALGL